MIQTQNYIVKKIGKIKGGTASYTADLDTGSILYQASVTVGIFLFTKTFNFSGSYMVSPDNLKSQALYGIGKKIQIGNVDFEVIDLQGAIATVAVTVNGEKMSGTALFDITDEYLKLLSLDANITVNGISAELSLSPLLFSSPK